LNSILRNRFDLFHLLLKKLIPFISLSTDDSWPSLLVSLSLGLGGPPTPSASSSPVFDSISVIRSAGMRKYASTLALRARFFSCAAIMVTLVLLSVRARLPRRDSRRVIERARLGVRERPPMEGERSLPTRRYSELVRFQLEQKGQKSHLISQPERASLAPQLERLAEGVQGRMRWYHRWRQGRSETFSSATHMFAVRKVDV